MTASADEHPDLFWALRGGGGNFGVVTSFLFRLHEVHTVFAGPTFWPVEQSVEVLSAYREFISDAPRELNGFFCYHTVPPARRSRSTSTCARCAASSGATSAARSRPPRTWRR